jgi:hypothetical protein
MPPGRIGPPARLQAAVVALEHAVLPRLHRRQLSRCGYRAVVDADVHVGGGRCGRCLSGRFAPGWCSSNAVLGATAWVGVRLCLGRPLVGTSSRVATWRGIADARERPAYRRINQRAGQESGTSDIVVRTPTQAVVGCSRRLSASSPLWLPHVRTVSRAIACVDVRIRKGRIRSQRIWPRPFLVADQAVQTVEGLLEAELRPGP